MTNTNNKKRQLGFRGDPRVAFAQSGWSDAREGRPINYRLLDQAEFHYQAQAYETARFRVMALREAGLPVPVWRSTKTVPPTIHAAINLANSFNSMSRKEGAGYWPIGPKYWQPHA